MKAGRIMPDSELMTIKQFALAAGVSTQRIYQRLAKDLQSYCKEINGSKYIDSEALALFEKSDTCKGLVKDLQTTCKEETGAIIADLRQQIDDLQQRLHDTELKAAAADAALAAERHRADEQTAALVSALDAVKAAQEHAESLTQALAAAQALHAGQLRLALSDDAENSSQSAESVKRGLFARLFRRK